MNVITTGIFFVVIVFSSSVPTWSGTSVLSGVGYWWFTRRGTGQIRPVYKVQSEF